MVHSEIFCHADKMVQSTGMVWKRESKWRESGADTYLVMIRTNVERIVEALK